MGDSYVGVDVPLTEPITIKMASTTSFTATMMLFARALCSDSDSRSHVTRHDDPERGNVDQGGIPATCGATSLAELWTVESWLSSAVRYPVVAHAGSGSQLPVSVLK